MKDECNSDILHLPYCHVTVSFPASLTFTNPLLVCARQNLDGSSRSSGNFVKHNRSSLRGQPAWTCLRQRAISHWLIGACSSFKARGLMFIAFYKSHCACVFFCQVLPGRPNQCQRFRHVQYRTSEWRYRCMCVCIYIRYDHSIHIFVYNFFS